MNFSWVVVIHEFSFVNGNGFCETFQKIFPDKSAPILQCLLISKKKTGNDYLKSLLDSFLEKFIVKPCHVFVNITTDQHSERKLFLMRQVFGSDESEPSWLEPELELTDFQLGSARGLFPFSSKTKIGRKRAEILFFQILFFIFFIYVAK